MLEGWQEMNKGADTSISVTYANERQRLTLRRWHVCAGPYNSDWHQSSSRKHGLVDVVDVTVALEMHYSVCKAYVLVV